MATHAPRSKAHDTLTPDELAALIASAERAGGWRALARGWEALGATTLQRLARGASATPTVLFTVRAQLASMTAPPTPPRAEGAHDGLWLVAYAAPCGALDVMAYRYRRDGAAVDLGACAWCGRVRDGRWSGVVGEPRASVLASAWRWVQAGR